MILSVIVFTLKKLFLPILSLIIVLLCSDFLFNTQASADYDKEFLMASDRFYKGTAVSCQEVRENSYDFRLLDSYQKNKAIHKCKDASETPFFSIIENLSEHIYAFLLCFSFMGVILGVKLKNICNSSLISDVILGYIVKGLWFFVVIAIIWSFTQRYIVMPQLDELLSVFWLYLSGVIIGFARA